MGSVACDLTCTTADRNLIERVCTIEDAPALSSQYQRLSKMTSSEPFDLVQFAAIIDERPALAAKLLKLANSAFYDPPVRIDSVNDAIEAMGVRGTVNMVLALELVKTFGMPKSIDIERFWDHAVAVATLAQELATGNDRDSETAYTIGLLHDVGLLMVARFAPAEFRFLMSQVGPKRTIYEMMPRMHGVSHFDFSIALLERWGFDNRFSEPLRVFEDSKGYSDPEIGQLSLLLRQAHAIAHDNRYAFCWDSLPEVAKDARLKSKAQPDFTSGIGAALLACCYK